MTSEPETVVDAGFIVGLIELNRHRGHLGRETKMKRKPGLSRAVLAALAVTAAAGLAGCGGSGHQAQATNTPASLTMATPAATAALPPPDAATQAGSTQPDAAAPAVAAAQPRFAQVVAVKPITEATTTSTPRQVCRDEQVAVPKQYKDKNQIGGGVVGGLVGGLVGNQIGGGKGKTLATVAGVAGGAYAGHEIQKHHQEKNATEMETRNVCHTVQDKTTSTRTVGYDVTYDLNGKTDHVRMDHDPGVGTGLPVKNGVVAVGEEGGSDYQ